MVQLTGKQSRIAVASRKTTVTAQIAEYFRSIGLVSLALGGASMMQGPDMFWWSTGLVYFGLSVLALDVFFKTWARWWVRWVLVGAIGVVIIFFSLGWVFVDLPIHVGAIVHNAEYQDGTNIGGIPWNPKYTELNVELVNGSTTRNYEDLDIIIKPNYPVAAIGQITNYSGVTFEDRHALSLHLAEIKGAQRTAYQFVLVATDAGYRVRCDKLPARASLRIVMAIVDVKNDPQPPPNPGEPIVTKEGLLTIKLNDGSTYWYGQKGVDHYTPRIGSPNTVEVSGDYVAGQRRRNVHAELKIR